MKKNIYHLEFIQTNNFLNEGYQNKTGNSAAAMLRRNLGGDGLIRGICIITHISIGRPR